MPFKILITFLFHLGWLDFYTTEWLPHLDQSYHYDNANHSLARLLKNLGAEGKPGVLNKLS